VRTSVNTAAAILVAVNGKGKKAPPTPVDGNGKARKSNCVKAKATPAAAAASN